MNNYRIEVLRSKKQFRFRIRAANGKLIAWSETYKRRSTMVRSINRLASGLKTAPVLFIGK